jgi:AraC-like DNA-binding protein
VAGRTWTPRTGDLCVLAPREVVDPGWGGHDAEAAAWTAFFPVDVVDVRAGDVLSWRTHPLLFPFVGSRAGGVQRLQVPEAERDDWSGRYAALARELADRRDGFGEAARALLTLLLVDLSRLAADVVGHLSGQDEPLLAAVFDVIERRYAESISLRDVAQEVGLTPGHLTTVVGRRTGRTVQQWLTERRMSEARRLLAGTTLPLEAIARRTGYEDTGYFVRRFRAAHGMPPGRWRRSA